MKKYSRRRTSLVFLLAICLSLPATVFGGGKSGKKNFKEGAKYESAEQWDLAAEQYALAVANESDNAEYRLRLLRAMQMASLMFAARGDLLEAKGDYAGAYNAYARAFIYDRANETTRIKMSRMIEQQKSRDGMSASARYNPRNGNPAATPTGTASSLADLGGLGRNGVSAISGSVLGLGGSAGALIGMPTSSLSLLQSKGKSKLLANTQIHALDGENNQVVVGRNVPIRVGTIYPTFPTPAGATSATGTVDNIQYRDVGLVIDVTPTVTNEGYVQVKMKLESSNVEPGGDDATLTPSFTKRQLTTISRVQAGVTAVVASVKQDNKGDSRVTIPGVGMIPILGRLFTTPRQTNNQSDIVITVTPHIIRPAEIKPEDHYARFAGTQQSGFTQSIEDVIYRAEVEEDQERRLISRQPSTPLAAPAAEASVDIRNAADDKASPPAKAIPVNHPAEVKPITKDHQ